MIKTNIQSEFLSTRNFKLAWERTLRSLHVENKDRIAFRAFSSDIDFHIDLLIQEIQANTYRPSQAHKLYLPKSSRTLRTIPLLSTRDRIVYQAMGNVIVEEAIPNLSVLSDRHIFAHLPQDNNSLFATKSWERQFANFSRKYEQIWKEGNKWVVESDISAFYSTINHQLLTELIRERWIADEVFLKMLNICLSTWSPHEKGPELGNGLPQGYETSDLLATLFLLPIDEKMIINYRYIRYVDDIRILTSDPSVASKALVSLDLELQARALILQTKKTAIAEVVNVKDEKTKLRRRFSIIKVLTKLNVSQRREFKVMFFEAIKNLNALKGIKRSNIFSSFRLKITTSINRIFLSIVNLLPSKIIRTYLKNYRLKSMFLEAWQNLHITPEVSDTTIAFTLYRLEKDVRIGRIALTLLEIIPSRSNIINNYLEKFEGEKFAIDGLIKILKSHNVYSWHLANCMRTLGKISDITSYRNIANEWISSTNLHWTQRLAAIEVLQNDQDSHALLYSAIKNEKNIILKRSLITACAYQAHSNNSIDEIKQLLNECFQDNEYEIRLLGIWLLRQFPEIEWQDMNFQSSLGVLQPLIPDAPQDQAESPCYIKQTLRTNFGVKIKEEVDFKKFFADYNGAVTDLLRAAAHYNTDPSLYVGLINSFNHRITIELQPIIGINLPKEQFGNMLQHGQFSAKAPEISLYFGKCNNKRSQTTGFHPYASALGAWSQTVTYKEKEEIHNGLKMAYQEFINIYENHLATSTGISSSP
jgi:hypothetical protein